MMAFRSTRARAVAAEELLSGPIVGVLLGADDLGTRARRLAREQRLVKVRSPLREARLLTRLADTRRLFRDAQKRLREASIDDAGPAAEWLLDNYYIVEEHLREVRASLPSGYYRELPELASGPMAGYPRIYELAIVLISHSEARIDVDNVDLFVDAFQSVTPLSVGELWAVPAMLRLGLIESVRRMTLRTLQRLDEIDLAMHWSDRIARSSAQGGAVLRDELRAFTSAEHELTPFFVSSFFRLLRRTEGASPPLAWLEQWTRDAGASPDTALETATHRATLTQLMMANSLTSLRDIGRRDWRQFVERQSVLDAVLRSDPAGVYDTMTFATRDHYRHVVERIAKATGHRETSVAQWAIDLASAPSDRLAALPRDVVGHVGFYLIDDGLPALEALAGHHPPLRERLGRAARTYPNSTFAIGLALLILAPTSGVLWILRGEFGPTGWALLLLSTLPALDMAVNVLNQLVTSVMTPRVLPRLDFDLHGVPVSHRTVVVVPVLLAAGQDVAVALETIEVQFLANREAHLHFAILSDFTDADSETLPSDTEILADAVAGITALNDRHGNGAERPFHLLHRPRQWNQQQGVWMGWERKRGKLVEFNRLVRGEEPNAFSTCVGELEVLRDAKYVITLDADTVLPPDAAPALVGAIAHPLNRAVYDEQRGVVRGFGILQPRVGVSLPSAHRSRFASIASGRPGVDPYSTAVSDVYQDLFGEGTFTGKGIYDVAMFERATHGRFPDNTLLSHDLIEGNYARVGLATDVVIYDDYPSSYVAYTRRKHRWIRGDWQLLPWLRRTVPGPRGPERNRLSLVSQWKMLDNLRRSTTEIAQLALIVGGWVLDPVRGFQWAMLALGAIVTPWITALLLAVVRPPRVGSWRTYYAAVRQDAVASLEQSVVVILTLPHQALISLDAICRTLFRLYVSHARMLEWQSALDVERSVIDVRAATLRMMRTSRFGAALLILALVAQRLSVLEGGPVSQIRIDLDTLVMALFSACWLVSPPLIARLSVATSAVRAPLTATMRTAALRYAALHWAYFAEYCTAESFWIAPDNVQTEPETVLALRTSPTNLGLQLLAIVSACDLGFITADEMTVRLERTLGTMDELPRYRGHFFNWYDLRDLRVLEPRYVSTVDSGNVAGHLVAVRQACLKVAVNYPLLNERLLAIADRAYDLVSTMDFSFLFDQARKLFTIGYHTDSFTPDDSYYDLLASEARLASFIAIARNDVPLDHWFRLSRGLSRTAGRTALLSWSGSMFEYLMPVLIMRSLPETLLSQTYVGVVDRQRKYGRRRGVPWGISESAYNVRDRHLTYQYRGFGIPDLALKRGLERDLVIAPYATALAAMIDPPSALHNLAELEELGALGPYGFCDAVDYTRPAADSASAVVRTTMVHHAGMTLTALTNVLLDDLWQDRFHADGLVRSVELLLHERVPRLVLLREVQQPPLNADRADEELDGPMVREMDTMQARRPAVALLGSSPYSVMVTQNGTGFSRYESLAVTRWNPDSTEDCAGQFCYVNDLTANRMWSTGRQPIGTDADSSRAWLATDRVTFQRKDGAIETRTEIAVVVADSAEVRRVTLTNTGIRTHQIELTSYGEITMSSPSSDAVHPAFSNLFVETEWHAWCTAVTATRRPRTPSDESLWCVHVVDAGREHPGTVSCETDRARFVGRGRTVRNPLALTVEGALSGTTGPVLDPIFALRTHVSVEPGHSVCVTFTTLVATSRKSAFALAGRYHDGHAAQRAFDFASTSTRIELREMGVSTTNAAVYQAMAAQIIFGRGSLAPPLDEVRRNHGSQPLLWAQGISGDQMIVLATIDSTDGLPTLRELFCAHRYWSRRGVVVDLVIVNAHPADYLQELRNAIDEAMIVSNDAALIEQPGGVFLRRREQFLPREYLMLSAIARVHVACDGRSLGRLLSLADMVEANRPAAKQTSLGSRDDVTPASSLAFPERQGSLAAIVSAFLPLVAPTIGRSASDPRPLSPDGAPSPFANGIGGLDESGSYCLNVDVGRALVPPAPWSNVIANPDGGFLVTERGAGCVFAENAFFYRLTPWHNDPVSDPIGDCIYIQDRSRNALWSATPGPVDHRGHYAVTHAPGESSFAHEHLGIQTLLRLGVPEAGAAKVSTLTLTNRSDETRRLLVTAYAEWVLGPGSNGSASHVRTEFDATSGTIFARSHFDPAFCDWVAFLTTSERVLSFSADREAFVGFGGSLAAPRALNESTLNNVAGAGLDPCGALQFEVILDPGESRTVVVLLGAAPTANSARLLADSLREPSAATAALNTAVATWTSRLSTITVQTPEPAFDAMINTWSLYQALACRMWARMGLYQSSGAYGFRDQLQDTMAFVYSEPGIARAHLLRSAARQFTEGDVQHWWHAHTGRGVRTRFSDDLAWLPYVTDHYVTVTGDSAVLDEYIPFLEMRALGDAEHELYDLPHVSDEHGTLYEHCRRALRRACTHGPHGLPLIGSGDWNDGMSRVGIGGRGESVWLAWFLIRTLHQFAPYAIARGDTGEAEFMRQEAINYTDAVERHGWDGAWYRRAFYDDGKPIGSSSNTECRIDSIAQSWSVLAGTALPDRQTSAMAALNEQLVDDQSRILLLLTPPFNGAEGDPGYIRGYVPGVRENGGQYTHAALWAVIATAAQGRGDRAFELFTMLNPLTHTQTAEGVARYCVEPYVIAADVYSSSSHRGRGGWTWYTGSASWMYRTGLEALLGFRKIGSTLRITPCVPTAWERFSVVYRFGSSSYQIEVREPGAIGRSGARVTIDGVRSADSAIQLVDDGRTVMVVVEPDGVVKAI